MIDLAIFATKAILPKLDTGYSTGNRLGNFLRRKQFYQNYSSDGNLGSGLINFCDVTVLPTWVPVIVWIVDLTIFASIEIRQR